jgi:hypothetical protein
LNAKAVGQGGVKRKTYATKNANIEAIEKLDMMSNDKNVKIKIAEQQNIVITTVLTAKSQNLNCSTTK